MPAQLPRVRRFPGRSDRASSLTQTVEQRQRLAGVPDRTRRCEQLFRLLKCRRELLLAFSAAPDEGAGVRAQLSDRRPDLRRRASLRFRVHKRRLLVGHAASLAPARVREAFLKGDSSKAAHSSALGTGPRARHSQ
jgi:hypothetical protein